VPRGSAPTQENAHRPSPPYQSGTVRMPAMARSPSLPVGWPAAYGVTGQVAAPVGVAPRVAARAAVAGGANGSLPGGGMVAVGRGVAVGATGVASGGRVGYGSLRGMTEVNVGG